MKAMPVFGFAAATLAATTLPACRYSPPSPPNAMPDAGGVGIVPPMPTPPNGVAIAVTADGAPVTSAPVYFQAADSTLVLATETDDTGQCGAAVPDGGFVTVLLRATADGQDADDVDQLFTFASVRANDVLHVDLRPPSIAHGVQYQTSLASTVPAATSYAVYSACSDEPSSLDASGNGSIVLVGCGSSADLVVVAQDDNGDPIAAEAVVGQALVDPGPSAGSTFPIESLQLPGGFGAFGDGSLAVANATATFAEVDGTVAVIDASGRSVFASTGAAALAGSASLALTLAPVAAGELALVTVDLQPGAGTVGEQLVEAWGAAAASYVVDGRTTLAEYATAPTLTGGTIAWTETGTGLADLVRVQVELSRAAIPEGHSWVWRAIAPRDAAPSLSLPALPFDGRFDYNPMPGDAAAFTELLDARVPGGYDAVRGRGFTDLGSAFDPQQPGSLVLETLSVPTL